MHGYVCVHVVCVSQALLNSAEGFVFFFVFFSFPLKPPPESEIPKEEKDKYQEEFQNFQQELDKKKEEFQKEHPDVQGQPSQFNEITEKTFSVKEKKRKKYNKSNVKKNDNGKMFVKYVWTHVDFAELPSSSLSQSRTCLRA